MLNVYTMTTVAFWILQRKYLSQKTSAVGIQLIQNKE